MVKSGNKDTFPSRNGRDVNKFSECCGDKCCEKDQKQVSPQSSSCLSSFWVKCAQKYDEEKESEVGWCYAWLKKIMNCWYYQEVLLWDFCDFCEIWKNRSSLLYKNESVQIFDHMHIIHCLIINRGGLNLTLSILNSLHREGFPDPPLRKDWW